MTKQAAVQIRPPGCSLLTPVLHDLHVCCTVWQQHLDYLSCHIRPWCDPLPTSSASAADTGDLWRFFFWCSCFWLEGPFQCGLTGDTRSPVTALTQHLLFLQDLQGSPWLRNEPLWAGTVCCRFLFLQGLEKRKSLYMLNWVSNSLLFCHYE